MGALRSKNALPGTAEDLFEHVHLPGVLSGCS